MSIPVNTVVIDNMDITRKELPPDILDTEKCITTKFSHVLFGRFTRAIKEYKLISAGDKIAVCISGGKDSMLMAVLFKMLSRISDVPFELLYLVMDPGYNRENRAIIEKNAEKLGVPIFVFESELFNSLDKANGNPCFLCSKMRRGTLYSKAQQLGCNKIAVGHHFDDIIETNLMSMIYGGQVETMLPKVISKNFRNMQLIRPLYLIREADIITWAEYNSLSFINCACRFTEERFEYKENGELRSKRLEIKRLIAALAKNNPQIEMNIFRSVENVDLTKIVSYKLDGKVTSFLDNFDD